MLTRGLLNGLVVGICAPVVATMLVMISFEMPPGRYADAFWTAIGVICPGWALINSFATFVAVSILDGAIYAIIGMAIAVGLYSVQRAR